MENNNLHHERELLQRIAEGDHIAYTTLFKQFLPRLLYSLELLTKGSSIIVPDVLQDVFLTIWEKRERLILINRFDDYLFRMARNRFLDLLRKEESIARLQNIYNQRNQQDVGDWLENQIQFDDYQKIAVMAVQELSPKLKSVFILKNEVEMTIDQIAEALQLPKDTVKKRLYLAGQSIRNYLRKHGEWTLFIIFFEKLLPLYFIGFVFI